MRATPNSKNHKKTQTTVGKIAPPHAKKEAVKSIDQPNPAITTKSVCPAIMLANKRTDKLKGLKKYEISSKGTNKKS